MASGGDAHRAAEGRAGGRAGEAAMPRGTSREVRRESAGVSGVRAGAQRAPAEPLGLARGAAEQHRGDPR